MTVLSKKNVNDHCHNLGISRDQLTEFTIPDGVTKIDYLLFKDCTSLTSVTIPDSVTKIGLEAFKGCTSLTHVICNNPDLFTYRNTENRDQIQFMSTQELLKVIEDSEFKSIHVTSKELNLIMKLHQEDYLPNWNTIATTFDERSMDQIRSILHYFNKTNCMPDTENSILLKKAGKEPASINSLSMFLNPIDHTNLSMTAKNVTFRTKEETQEHEQESTSYCSIQQLNRSTTFEKYDLKHSMENDD